MLKKSEGHSELDQDLYEELRSEVAELSIAVENAFFQIEKVADFKTDSEIYNSLLRDIHSIKGSLGMMNLPVHMRKVHEVETFLIATHPKVGFSHGIVDLMIDFWGKFNSILNKEEGSNLSDFNFSNCFDCLERSDYKSVCVNHYTDTPCGPIKNENIQAAQSDHYNEGMLKLEGSLKIESLLDKKQAPPSEIFIITENADLIEAANKLGLKYSHFHCVNEFYRKSEKLKNAKAIICDISTLKVNPLVMQDTINLVNEDVVFCYFLENKNQLIDVLDEFEELQLPFYSLFKGSEKLQDQLKAFLRNIK